MLYLLIDMQGIVQKAVYKSHISVSVIFVDRHAGHFSEGCLYVTHHHTISKHRHKIKQQVNITTNMWPCSYNAFDKTTLRL